MTKQMCVKRGGFTLLELMVTVLIMGVLTAMSLPRYFKLVERARVTEATVFFGSVKSAQTRVMARNGTYTDNWSMLDITFRDINNKECSGVSGCAQKAYLYTLGSDGTIYAARNLVPVPPELYGRYILLYDINSGETTCTQANCILDLI